jgi:hypothetical protein
MEQYHPRIGYCLATVSCLLPTEAINRDVLAEYGPKQHDIHQEGENSPARKSNDL